MRHCFCKLSVRKYGRRTGGRRFEQEGNYLCEHRLRVLAWRGLGVFWDYFLREGVVKSVLDKESLKILVSEKVVYERTFRVNRAVGFRL